MAVAAGSMVIAAEAEMAVLASLVAMTVVLVLEMTAGAV